MFIMLFLDKSQLNRVVFHYAVVRLPLILKYTQKYNFSLEIYCRWKNCCIVYNETTTAK